MPKQRLKSSLSIRLALAITAVAVAGSILLSALQPRPDATAAPPSLENSLANEDAPDEDTGSFIVHEWGTFTTFSGSDGVHLDYRPLDIRESDLPRFVQDRAHFDSLPPMVKRRLLARVRMETPITYFYTDEPLKVRVRVDFPEGMLTEFYPPVRSVSPKFDRKVAYTDGELIGNSSIDWGEIQLLPPSSFRPPVPDDRLANHIQRQSLLRLPPDATWFPHYAHARIPDAAMVHTQTPTQINAPPEDHFERFLFYRGVGKFQLPIEVRFDDEERMVLANNGDHALHAAVLIDVHGETIRSAVVGSVASHSTTTLPHATSSNVDQAAQQVVDALVGEGLYLAEAEAMVATWRESWFAEQGTRLLYMVPGEITDKLLPLSIEPAPEKMLRVLVGRLEIMSPSAERNGAAIVAASLKQYEAYEKRKHEVWNQDGREAAEALTQPSLPEELVRLDRFAEPSLARVIATSDSFKIRQEAKRLIQELRSAAENQK